ncbi:MAG: hypothetical protein ACE5FZ_09110 [Nitrospiria bacterium]
MVDVAVEHRGRAADDLPVVLGIQHQDERAGVEALDDELRRAPTAAAAGRQSPKRR